MSSLTEYFVSANQGESEEHTIINGGALFVEAIATSVFDNQRMVIVYEQLIALWEPKGTYTLHQWKQERGVILGKQGIQLENVIMKPLGFLDLFDHEALLGMTLLRQHWMALCPFATLTPSERKQRIDITIHH